MNVRTKNALHHLFSNKPKHQPKPGELNGTEAANRAVAECAPDSSMIFLTRSEYQDLIYRAHLAELKTYKGKYIWIVSDAADELVNLLLK